MLTTNLIAIAKVKQLQTYVEFYCFFFPKILVCWLPKFSIFLTVFTIGLSLAQFFGVPSEFWGGFEYPKRPLGMPLVITHLLLEDRNIYLHRYLEIPEIGRSTLPGVTVQEMSWFFEIIVQLGHHQWDKMKD